jgi:hypothetical protein
VPQTLPVDQILKPLNLSAQEIDDVVAFLNTLTEKSAAPLLRRRTAAACR